jgi:predicted metal-dependent phosphoesterase TrpH
MFADLHLHTNFSDGTFSPEELAGEGRRHGFAALALTDHDTVEGCARMGAACASHGIEFIPGTELTADWQGIEVHILGYLLDVGSAELTVKMTRFQDVRQQRIKEMVARLNELNIPLKAESVFALANCRSPGRPHVARALVEQGFCGSLDEAFDRYLKAKRPAWVPKFKMSFSEAVDLIHAAGGLAVMAHPGLNRADRVIPELIAAGIDGIECYHTKHSASNALHYVNLARQYGLLITGGSDCHGMSKGKPVIGTVRLDYEHVAGLKAAVRTRQQPQPEVLTPPNAIS